jgi:hypothetical protein
LGANGRRVATRQGSARRKDFRHFQVPRQQGMKSLAKTRSPSRDIERGLAISGRSLPPISMISASTMDFVTTNTHRAGSRSPGARSRQHLPIAIMIILFQVRESESGQFRSSWNFPATISFLLHMGPQKGERESELRFVHLSLVGSSPCVAF